MLIDRLHYALGLDTTELKRGWANADNILMTIDGKMSALAAGAGIGALTLAIGKIGWEATDMAMELDAAMGEVWSITDKTREEMEGITKDILNLSTRIPERAPALAKAYYQTLSAGITDTNKALEVTSVAAKAATAGLTTTFNVVDAITNVLNAYKREASEAAEISDDLFIAVRDGKINMEQLAPAIGAVVGTAALAKVELKEVLAAIVAMTLSGYSVDESVTSINRLLLSIVDTQDEAKDAAKSLGIEWSVAGMQAKGFQGFIRDLNEKAGDNIEVLQKIVPEVRAFRAAAVIAGTGADAYARSLDNLKNSAGATDQAFAKIMDDAKKQYDLQKNRLNAAFTELGYKILPYVKDSLRLVNDAFAAVGLAGETEAKRLQREWQFVGETIKSVGDIAARSAAMQKALGLLLAPGQSPMETLQIVEEVTNFLKAFPVLSERATQIQQQQKITAGQLVDAFQAELEHLKKIQESAEAANLQDKQRLVSIKELREYEAQVLAMQKQAKALGMDETYRSLGAALGQLKASEKAWNDEKRASLLANAALVQNQITMAKAAEAAQADQIQLRVDLLDKTQKLLISENALLDLDKARKDLAREMAKARGEELEKMKAMERIKPSEWYQWMPQSTISQAALIPAMATPKTQPLKVFNSELEKLWATFAYGEDSAQNFAMAGMKLVDTFIEGNEQARQFAGGFIQVIEGLETKNPLSIFEGLVDIFGGLFGSGKEAGDATKSLTERMEAYTDQLREMSYVQIQAQLTNLESWYSSLSGLEKTIYKKFYEEKLALLNDQLANFGKWGDDFTSMIERWNYEVRLLDIEDPAEKFRLLAKYAKQYLGIDLPDNIEEGFSAIRTFLDSLGSGKSIKEAWLAAFGTPFPVNLTEEQLRELIELYKDGLQDIKDWQTEQATEGTKTEEESVAFTRTKQITYRQADEMTLALWSIDTLTRNIYKLLDARLSSGSNSGGTAPATGTDGTPVNWADLISKVNLFATNVYVSTQNCIVDVIKAQVYLSGITFEPTAFSGLIYQESNRTLRSQGASWVS